MAESFQIIPDSTVRRKADLMAHSVILRHVRVVSVCNYLVSVQSLWK